VIETTKPARPSRRSRPESALPAFRPFQLATLADKVPSGPDWLFEMKFDGYRCEAAISGGQVRLYSRQGHDWTKQFGYVAPALAKLTKGTLLIDGEICAFDDYGRSDFSLLKNSLDGHTPIRFMAFDLLEQDGELVWRLPQVERKNRLEALLGPPDPSSPVQYSHHVEGHGKEVLAAMCEGGFEGVVAKRTNAIYHFRDRSPNWIKVKCVQRQEFIVIGWRPPAYGPDDVRALFLATYENGQLVYRGSVGSGVSEKDRRELLAALSTIRVERLPVKGLPRAEARVIRWVQPLLLAEVAFTEITPDGLVRHPSFKGIRLDKEPHDVHLEEP